MNAESAMRTIVARRLEPVWESCTYYIEVPADMELPLLDPDDPDSDIDVDELLYASTAVRADTSVFDTMAGAEPTDWKIIDLNMGGNQ